VSIFDIGQLVRLYDVRVGRRPVRLAVAGNPPRLFVACRLNDSVDVVDLSSRSVVASLPVGQEPTAVGVDRSGRRVLVGHRSSPFLNTFDADSLAPGQPIQVGNDVTAVLGDVNRDRAFVARARPAEIAIVDLRQETVIRRIPISGRVEALAQPRAGSFLYGAAPDLGALVVVNVVRLREQDSLPCGGAPSYVVTTD
jgi:YVTN family beta-propeller protein